MVANEIPVGASSLQTLTNMFTAPGQAFGSLKERPTSLFPVLLLLAATALVALWYYSGVDLVWLFERSMDAANTQVPADSRRQTLELIGKIPPYGAGIGAAVASIVSMLLILMVGAAYLAIVSLFTNDGYNFVSWFSFAAWSSLPLLLGLLATLVNLAINDVSHLPPEQLNPLSLAYLLGIPPGAGGARLLQVLSLPTFWVLGLMVYGYSRWTGKGLGASTAIVAGPLIVIAGLVALVALR